MTDYPAFPKIPRLHRQATITEKIDGTNGLIQVERVPFGTGADSTLEAQGVYTVTDFDSPLAASGLPEWEFQVRAGSRNRWLAPGADNFGFAAWVGANAVELSKLGPGRHYGEWFGKGIQRGYGLNERRFALFNVGRWFDPRSGEDGLAQHFPKRQECPEAVTVVPVLWVGNGKHLNFAVEACLRGLTRGGSLLVEGFPNPEGLIVYHEAGKHTYKVLTESDDKPKGVAA